jgi:hypothetical protein
MRRAAEEAEKQRQAEEEERLRQQAAAAEARAQQMELAAPQPNLDGMGAGGLKEFLKQVRRQADSGCMQLFLWVLGMFCFVFHARQRAGDVLLKQAVLVTGCCGPCGAWTLPPCLVGACEPRPAFGQGAHAAHWH